MKKRNQIAEKYKWNFESYYKSDDDWQKTYNSYSSNISQIKKYDGFLLDKVSFYVPKGNIVGLIGENWTSTRDSPSTSRPAKLAVSSSTM